MQEDLKEVELYEIEVLLGLLGGILDLTELTSDQIASEIQQRYSVKCSGEEVFLLHEPAVYDVWYEDAYYYKNVLGL